MEGCTLKVGERNRQQRELKNGGGKPSFCRGLTMADNEMNA